MVERLDLGVVGVSEGNGHPYSFASIVNGYSDEGFARTEWDVIHDYLREKDPSEFGFPGVGVTHAWTQDEAETERLCEAARIPNAAKDLESLGDAVDAVIIARDDYETHAEMALPFLEDGTPVFLDKPLTMDRSELAEFRPYLERGQLMSCSGMRYAQSLDVPRAHTDRFGDVELVRGTVIKNWPKYGAHMLDAIFGVLDQRPVAVETADADHTSAAIRMDGGTLVQVDTLGDVPMTFSVDVYGTERTGRYDLRDNFTAFRRTLWRFVETVRTGEPVLDPEETLDVIRTLVAGHIADEEDRQVSLDELGHES
ncbi:Gfo/Idh/MocA family protein [Halorussus salinisoli]|uniref:Gfo/Idh/MocA family protein n=1 Tax=Halorussus salinisoli TaxID=2558242 RepID=UPI001485BC10|nr:Gfo/Idh/MocA family oxidoreductase [Halorussus salinisoli]